MPKDNGQEIRDRTFVFACNVARLALNLAPVAGVRSIVDQLLKAGTGIAANLEEAKAGSSRKEFKRFVEIALREARESLYWLRICEALRLGPADTVRELQGEADQLVRILTVIVINTKRRMRVGVAITAFWVVLSAAFVS